MAGQSGDFCGEIRQRAFAARAGNWSIHECVSGHCVDVQYNGVAVRMHQKMPVFTAFQRVRVAGGETEERRNEAVNGHRQSRRTIK